MHNKYLLGVDLGSGAAKVTLLSTQGVIVATASKEYPTYYPQVSWAEQEPEDWIAALRDNLKEIIDKTGIDPKDIIAVAPDATTHTAVLLDEKFNVLRRAILWTDQRSRKQSEYLKSVYADRIFTLSYHAPDPMWTLPQLMWVKENESKIWEETKRILFAKDYLRFRLTGEYVTDSIDALGSMLLDAKEKTWSQELCDILGLSAQMLPRIVNPTDIVGAVTAKAAQETGLCEGTVVVAGASDTALEVFAAGAVRTGQSTIKLATSGRICVITDQAYPHPLLVNYSHVVSGKWYPGTGTKACASSYRWYRDIFGDTEIELGRQIKRDAYQLLDEAAGKVPVGSEGLFYHPYLLGELTPYADPYLKASFTGISARHTKAHFTRAVLEGIAFSLHDCLDTIQEIGLVVKDARIIGGGAKSPLWRQIVSDVLGLELSKPAVDDSSFGSAMLAGVGIGIFSSFEQAADNCVSIQSITSPNMENHQKYEKLFEIYKEIHDGLAPIYQKLANIQ